MVYIFVVLIFILSNLRRHKLLTEFRDPVPGNTIVSEDAFDFMMNPETSRRDNFGVLFARSLAKAGKTRGNFLEIGGGSGKFFDHNMNTFGHLIENYVIIEPYALISKNGKPLSEFLEQIDKWELKVRNGSSKTKVSVIHDFSTKDYVISTFSDSYFDFVYIDGDHSYAGAKADLRNYYAKVKRGGVIAGHDYCCSLEEYKAILHAPWCGTYIFPHSTSTKSKDGKKKASWCGIFKGAEEFAKEHNFYWFYTLEGRYGANAAGRDNPSYFTFKQI